MSALLWRLIAAVIAVVFLLALLPPMLRIFGLSFSGDAEQVIRICIGGIALLWVLFGTWKPSWPSP